MSVIGIDFGTTHARVAAWSKGNISRTRSKHVLSSKDVTILVNEQGFRSTPCYVSFHEEVLVGDAAYNNHHSNILNTFFHSRKFLGKSYCGKTKYPFLVSAGNDNSSIFKVQHNETEKDISPEEVCAEIMKSLKEMADSFTGCDVRDAVLAVPVHFSSSQKESLLRAAEITGLNVLRLISEPAATAISFSLDEKLEPPQNELVAIIDLGGASFDVCIMNVDQGIMKIITDETDDQLGGEFFTEALLKHCVELFKKKEKIDITNNVKSMHKLKISCEAAKRSLSQQNQVLLSVDSLAEGIDFSLKLSRSRFEDIIYEEIRKCMKVIDLALENANLCKEDIDRIVIAGGSSRLPIFKESVSKYFGKDVEMSANPDEAIAIGAAMQAIMLSTCKDLEFPDIQHVDVTPLSLGIAAADGSMIFMIERESVLPTTHTERFSTSLDKQNSIFLEIYEGERLIAKENTLLGQLALENLPELPAAEIQIDLTFSVNKFGVLHVKAVEVSTDLIAEITIKNDDKRLTKMDVERLVQEAEEKADDDQELIDSLQSKLQIAESVEDTVEASNVPSMMDDDLD